MYGYNLSMGVNNIQAGETDVKIVPHREFSESDVPIILLHGATAPNNFAQADRWASSRMAARLAMAGYPCISGHMGGDSFANDTSMTRVDQALAEISDATGCSSTQCHLIGCSMGAGVAVRWAAENPTKALSVTGLIPMANIDALYQANTLGLRASIGLAWGVVYPAALPADANLLTHGAVIGTNEIPTRFYYDDADAAINPVDVLALAAACEAETFEVPPDLGHTESTINAIASIGGSDWSGLIDWLQSIAA